MNQTLNFFLCTTILTLSLGLTGCADDQEVAIEKCEDLVNNICELVVECGFDTLSSCKSTFKASGFDCERAVDVSSSYESCMEDIDAQTCSTFLNGDLPESCNGVILSN